MDSKTACFTGHRPEKIFENNDDISVKLALLKRQIRLETERAIQNGTTEFMSGMARGTDIFSAEIVLHLKNKNPHIKLTCVLPFARQGEGFSDGWRFRFDNIIEKCDNKIVLTEEYAPSCFAIRNRYMVEHSALVIAVFNGHSGGTSNTVAYAKKKDKQVVVINPNKLITQP